MLFHRRQVFVQGAFGVVIVASWQMFLVAQWNLGLRFVGSNT
jgi:hypothetical protein